MNTFQMFYRVVYGNQKIYPANQVAQQFARLLGVKTFSTDQVMQIQALGFEIDNVRDPAAPLFGTQGERLNLAWEAAMRELEAQGPEDLDDIQAAHDWLVACEARGEIDNREVRS